MSVLTVLLAAALTLGVVSPVLASHEIVIGLQATTTTSAS